LNERDQLTSAQIDQQQKMAEHDLVIKTLEPLDGSRKCFRLVGDVLVERTVAEVLPAVKGNRDHLAAVSEQERGAGWVRAGDWLENLLVRGCCWAGSRQHKLLLGLAGADAHGVWAVLQALLGLLLYDWHTAYTLLHLPITIFLTPASPFVTHPPCRPPDPARLPHTSPQLVSTYAKQLEAKQKEVLAYQEKYNIRIKGEGGSEEPAGGSGGKPGGASQGVLVGS